MTSDLINDSAKTPAKPAEPALGGEIWTRDTMKGDAASSSSSADTTKASLTTSLLPVTITDNNSKTGASDGNRPAGEANSLLLQAADQSVNQSIYKLPSWASLPKPSPGLGCVSSFSNRYREALHLAGLIDSTNDKQYRNYYQVNMDDLNAVMGRDQVLEKVAGTNVKEGDIIEGVNPGTTSRHIGIVGRIENGLRMVYDNYGGIFRKEPLDVRFGQYKENNYFRAFLPQKADAYFK